MRQHQLTLMQRINKANYSAYPSHYPSVMTSHPTSPSSANTVFTGSTSDTTSANQSATTATSASDTQPSTVLRSGDSVVPFDDMDTTEPAGSSDIPAGSFGACDRRRGWSSISNSISEIYLLILLLLQVRKGGASRRDMFLAIPAL